MLGLNDDTIINSTNDVSDSVLKSIQIGINTQRPEPSSRAVILAGIFAELRMIRLALESKTLQVGLVDDGERY